MLTLFSIREPDVPTGATYPVFKLGRLHAAGAEEEVDPFFLCEVMPRINNLILIKVGHLIGVMSLMTNGLCFFSSSL